MAYRYGQDRKQMLLFPQSIDQYVTEDHPVRAYDAFVDALNFNELGIDLDAQKVGNCQYHPHLMLKLLLFGYSYGIKSSRKLERETYNNIAFIWLMKNLKPDHKTIAEFRRKNKKALIKALKLCARLCLKLDLIEGNILFVDGTKIRANAGKKQQHKKIWYQNQLKQIDQRINQLLADCEQVDENEADQGSWAKMPKELGQQQRLKQTIVSALDELAQRSSHTKNGKERQVSDANDQNQFAPQIKAAEETLDKKCKIACADAGYSNIEHLNKVESEQTKVILPSQKQASGKPPGLFDKSQFVYDQQTDCYRCPQGQRLIFRRLHNKEGTKRDYRIEKPAICRACQHFGSCTKSNQGRTVVRHVNEQLKEHIEQRFAKPEYRQIYEKRKERVEHPFGYIKKAIGFSQFGLKGLHGAQAEAAIVATCFNLTRMIGLLGGVRSFNARLQAA
jgi:transposase